MQIVGGWGGVLGAQLASRHFEATLERSLNEAAPGHQVFIIAMKDFRPKSCFHWLDENIEKSDPSSDPWFYNL